MLKHKRTLAGILAATMMLSMAACGGGGSTNGGDSNAAEGPQDPNAAAAARHPGADRLGAVLRIFNTDETDEELYEKAKEEGKVTVYSISSRVTKVAKAFAEKYPGVDVEPFDISTNELLEKVTREYDAGQHVADVVHINDQDGTLYNEYVTARKFYNYKPADILSHIDEKYTSTQTPLYIELTQLFYNAEANPDGSPDHQHLAADRARLEGPRDDAEPAGQPGMGLLDHRLLRRRCPGSAGCFLQGAVRQGSRAV